MRRVQVWALCAALLAASCGCASQRRSTESAKYCRPVEEVHVEKPHSPDELIRQVLTVVAVIVFVAIGVWAWLHESDTDTTTG